ncbi:MAG TPA: hypothetical protein VJR48_06670 [Ktedonobacterales bacterium]|nr:hypothetical protein [Ktedonobacterales bacterium]
MAQRNFPSPTGRGRLLQRTEIAIRLGATIFGVLAGVVCYVALDQFTAIGLLPAFVIGLVFALLTRTASASLARDWLVRNATRANNRRNDPPPPRAG